MAPIESADTPASSPVAVAGNPADLAAASNDWAARVNVRSTFACDWSAACSTPTCRHLGWSTASAAQHLSDWSRTYPGPEPCARSPRRGWSRQDRSVGANVGSSGRMSDRFGGGRRNGVELAFAGLHVLCAAMVGRLPRLPGPQRDALNTAFGLSAVAARSLLRRSGRPEPVGRRLRRAAAHVHRRRRAVAGPGVCGSTHVRRAPAAGGAGSTRVRAAWFRPRA